MKRFAAFAAGAWLRDVVMVGGVHEFVGAKRAAERVDERQVAQRDERSERRDRREQRRSDAQQQQQQRRDGGGGNDHPTAIPQVRCVPVATREAGSPRQREDDLEVSAPQDGAERSDGVSESGAGGSGGWAAGGLGDRTGVG